MPKNGPFPSRETDLNQYYQIVVPYLNVAANTTRLLVSATNKTNMTTYFGQWNTYFPASQNPDTATKTVVDNKNTTNKNLQTTLRAIFNDIPESVLTAQDRNTLNLPARSTKHTPSAVPDSKPVPTVDTGNRLEHTISFVDEDSPTSRAKPDGVRGCQIWCKVGAPAPADADELKYIATCTASPYTVKFKGADGGKPAYYWLRWENTVGETGPWSDVAMATITASS